MLSLCFFLLQIEFYRSSMSIVVCDHLALLPFFFFFFVTVVSMHTIIRDLCICMVSLTEKH